MELTVEVVGEGNRELDLDADATYGDVVRAVGFSTQEATALVDGTPVPEDAPVDADRVTVLRLIKGGCESAPAVGARIREGRVRWAFDRRSSVPHPKN